MGGKVTIDAHLDKIEKADKGAIFEAKLLQQAIKRSTSIYRPKEIVVDEKLPEDAKYRNLKIGLLSRDVEHNASARHQPDRCELEVWAPQICLFPAAEGSTDAAHSTVGYYQILVPSDVGFIETVRQKLFEGIRDLCQDGADIICVNELGYPAYNCPAGSEICEADRRRLVDGDETFRADVQALADKHNCLILCGTHHDASDIHNKAMIFFPEDQFSPREHIKLTTAKSINVREIVRTPSNDEFILYRTRFGEIAVFICLDAYDLNMFFRQLYRGIHSHDRNDHTPDIIFVPAYSPKPLEQACESLSYFAASTVVYCNTKNKPFNGVYVGGESIEPLENVEKRIVHLPMDIRKKQIDSALERWKSGVISNIHQTFSDSEE